ncbi:MAG: hypothetical protein JSV91_14865 [Phycisphaerales bacterium]|nr:MAG: hypothetical protein JSV91_14865 [Phycisphaerales bacterium]
MTSHREERAAGSILRLPEPLRESLREFVREEGLPTTPSLTRPAAVTVRRSDEQRECDAVTLWTGGWITGPAAREAAERLGVNPDQMGRPLSFLSINVCHCEPGIFP